MSLLRQLLSAAAGLAIAGLASSQSSDFLSLQANVALGLEDSQVLALDVPQEPGMPLLVDLTIDGMPLTLDLAPHSVRAHDFQVFQIGAKGSARIEPGALRTVRGSALEDPGSVVAGSLLDDGLYARIRLSSGDEYWLQPLASVLPAAGSADHVVYHGDDISDVDGFCGADRLAFNEPKFTPPPGPPQYGTGLKVAEVGIDADVEYFNDYGSTGAAQARIELVLNTMNIQYETEVGITHVISALIIRTVTGPYTSTNPFTLLDQFLLEWTTTQAALPRDVAQLFTGKNLDGNVIGVAYVGVICNFDFQYGLVESDFNGNFACATDLSAHEFGHNWDAGHCSCGSNTMNPSITCTNTFHPTFTIPDIIAHRDAAGCLHDDTCDVDLFFDDFESGSFAPEGWAISSPVRCKVLGGGSAHTSNFGAKIKKTASIENSVSTTGFSGIRVEFWHKSKQYEAGEMLTLEWFDGAVWNTAASFTDTTWTQDTVALPAGADNNASFAFRFVTNAKGKKERSNVDDVRVIGM